MSPFAKYTFTAVIAFMLGAAGGFEIAAHRAQTTYKAQQQIDAHALEVEQHLWSALETDDADMNALRSENRELSDNFQKAVSAGAAVDARRQEGARQEMLTLVKLNKCEVAARQLQAQEQHNGLLPETQPIIDQLIKAFLK